MSRLDSVSVSAKSKTQYPVRRLTESSTSWTSPCRPRSGIALRLALALALALDQHCGTEHLVAIANADIDLYSSTHIDLAVHTSLYLYDTGYYNLVRCHHQWNLNGKCPVNLALRTWLMMGQESAAATSSHSSTSTTAAGESSPTSSPVPASGISSGASAGIGIGVAVVVVAAAIIAFCMLKKRKNKAAPRQSMDISKPLPGSGRTYPTRDQQHHDHGRDSYEHKYDNDIEMTSNRYEDMVESQQPRTMV